MTVGNPLWLPPVTAGRGPASKKAAEMSSDFLFAARRFLTRKKHRNGT